jgi:glyoxylase-like metal-dependent hydrolase (beta-lactamase superfamily II)
MRRLIVSILPPLAAAFAGGLLAAALCAQPQAAPLSIEPLNGGVYLARGGSGANAGFVVTRDEVVVIEAKMTRDSAQEMLAEIRKLTPLPVRRVILTHSDGDHVNGLAGFPKGLAILAHPNTRKDMEAAFQDPKLSDLKAYLPTETVAGDRMLQIGGVTFSLRYFGPAHTSGDLVVHLPAQKIAFIGDLAFTGRDPLIHRHKAGNSQGLVRTMKGIVSLDADTFIAGHAAPLKKSDIQELAASIEAKQAKVAEMVRQGRSWDEIRSAFGVSGQPGGAGQQRPGFIEVIYLELTGK